MGCGRIFPPNHLFMLKDIKECVFLTFRMDDNFPLISPTPILLLFQITGFIKENSLEPDYI